jgi:hypothetical protein
MIFDTSFHDLWRLLGYIGLLCLMGVFHWWLFKGCERYTRGELSRAFPEVARPVLIHRVTVIIALVLALASGLLTLGIFELLPESASIPYMLLFMCAIPGSELRLNLKHGVYIGRSVDGVYYVRDGLPARKRSTLVATKIILLVGLLLASGFTLIATLGS